MYENGKQQRVLFSSATHVVINFIPTRTPHGTGTYYLGTSDPVIALFPPLSLVGILHVTQ